MKVDGSFVHTMLSEVEDAGIVRAFVGLAHGLGITVAAEGIQYSAQQTSLIQTGASLDRGACTVKRSPPNGYWT